MPKWTFIEPRADTVRQSKREREKLWYEQHRNLRAFARLANVSVGEARQYIDRKLYRFYKAHDLLTPKTNRGSRAPKRRIWRPEDER